MSRSDLAAVKAQLPRLQPITADLNQLVQLQTAPADNEVLFSSFAGGYDTHMAAEQLPAHSSPMMLDFEVTRGDRLVRAPGTTSLEILDHQPSQILVHSSLDATSELLLFAAPWVGVKKDITTTWKNEGILPGGHWVGTNFAGTYIFTNARETVYARDPGDQNIHATIIPVARTLAAWNNRLWGGNAIIGGNFLPMGMFWSSASGGYEDFTGVGTGYEELIYDFAADDGIVALRPMSLDFMAVLCKKSVWIATRTSDVYEPGQFSPVEPGIGCVNETTARVVYGGVEFLSDVGVQVFDGQRCNSVSEQINAELLPLDYVNIDKYWGHYDSRNRRYLLGCPDGVWVHDISFQRWYKRSLVAISAANFPPEMFPLTWADEVGTWAQVTDDWSDQDPRGKPDRTVFLNSASLLHAEDYASTSYFGAPFVAKWRSKNLMAQKIGQQVIVKGLQFRYKGAGEIKTLTQDSNGELIEMMTRTLPDSASRLQDATYVGTRAGLRAAVEIQLLSGFVEFDMVGISVQIDTLSGLRL